MENLMEKENQLSKKAESGDYWDILELADFLYDQKRYDEAEEQYLKIAGENDISGDANAHLFQLLLDMGEYEESLKFYGYVQNCCDTSPREGAYIRMAKELSNPESKLFMCFDEDSFYYEWLPFICDYYASFKKYSQLVDGNEEDDDCGNIETGELYLTQNIETILLTRAKSEDEEVKKYAKKDLFSLYLKGNFRFGDFYLECSKRNTKNIRKAIKASIVFAEYPDIIDSLYGFGHCFLDVIVYIYEIYKGKAHEYTKRFVVEILKRAEELGNVEEVFNKIENELSSLYANWEDGIPFHLGFIPKGLSRVPTIAFSCSYGKNEELESIVIPHTIKKIETAAFYKCTSLKRVEIPSSVLEVGMYAFHSCKSLESIIIPESVVEMGDFVFEGCTSLETIYCEAEEEPEGWSNVWNVFCDAEVIWGYKK